MRKPGASLLATFVLSSGCAVSHSLPEDSDAGSDGGDPIGLPDGSFAGDATPPQGDVAAVYANSQLALYKLQPHTKELTKVGDFDCTVAPYKGEASGEGMQDIAIDANGQMYGIGMTGGGGGFSIVSIDSTTAKCTKLLALPTGWAWAQGLTFVPEGVLGTSDIMVGFKADATYARYDIPGGETVLGTIKSSLYGPCKSGDVVSLKGGSTYALICNTAGPAVIVTIDPATGAIQSPLGNVPLGGGLAFWEGMLYVFGWDGKIYAVDTVTSNITDIPLSIEGVRFEGAAVTTIAPLLPPK